MMTSHQAQEVAQRYTDSLIKANIAVSEVYLFGSFSQGTQHNYSDIDIAIISPDFGKCRPDERVRLMTVPFDPQYNIQPHPIGLSAFTSADWDPFIDEVKKGMRIV